MPRVPMNAAAQLDKHNKYVFEEISGISEAEIDEMRDGDVMMLAFIRLPLFLFS